METKQPTAEASDLVRQGVDLYAGAECALRDAAEAVLALRALHEDGYVAGVIPRGDTALNIMDECLSIAGAIGDIKKRVLACHGASAKVAQKASVDIAEPFAELPPRQTRSGGR